MGQVKLEIGGRSFMVTCQDGEEAHLGKLAAMVSEKAGEAGDPAGLTESRMLLFTSLLLADELHAQKKAPPPAAPASASSGLADEKTVAALEKLAERAESFANSLEQATDSA
ncbi:cell division protein ZapA [Parasphingorhabdus marina DSM 22363]|uniref:Cell division protein ZapA n=1 Tax=Parasphingorhabdus marina DSM 22363 TaxID=1123272 RepID=A0A1N6G2V8_9SPHN|nr:cell division protein ZapA [Parasphingorhabdus marina]SIO01864.1 cell division protein ZapA [Parasphingorhabdus marina DSM 22363]